LINVGGLAKLMQQSALIVIFFRIEMDQQNIEFG
jgi:hypothetical protein